MRLVYLEWEGCRYCRHKGNGNWHNAQCPAPGSALDVENETACCGKILSEEVECAHTDEACGTKNRPEPVFEIVEENRQEASDERDEDKQLHAQPVAAVDGFFGEFKPCDIVEHAAIEVGAEKIWNKGYDNEYIGYEFDD